MSCASRGDDCDKIFSWFKNSFAVETEPIIVCLMYSYCQKFGVMHYKQDEIRDLSLRFFFFSGFSLLNELKACIASPGGIGLQIEYVHSWLESMPTIDLYGLFDFR